MPNYLNPARRNRMNTNPVSVGDTYIMPLNAKVYSITASPEIGSGALNPTGSVLASAPQNNAQQVPVTNNNVTIGGTSATGGVFATKPDPVTIALGTPAVFTYAGHGLVESQLIMLKTTGALPTGITASTFYYVTQPTTDTFKLIYNTQLLNASGTQSGVHSLLA